MKAPIPFQRAHLTQSRITWDESQEGLVRSGWPMAYLEIVLIMLVAVTVQPTVGNAVPYAEVLGVWKRRVWAEQ